MGGRAAEAAFYPQQLIVEILRGIRDTADAEEHDPEDVIPAHLSTLMSAAEKLHDLPNDPILLAIQEADATQKDVQPHHQDQLCRWLIPGDQPR